MVTFKDIDLVHERPEGTAGRNFRENKKRFIEGEDYFQRNSSEVKEEYGIIAPNSLTLITEQGYLILVKSFTDDLAWEVQRKLVSFYFKVERIEPKIPFKEQLEAAAFVADDLHVPTSNKIMMFRKVYENNYVNSNFLPAYAQNEDEEAKPVPVLLKEFNCTIRTVEFNKLLLQAGILEEKESQQVVRQE